MNLLHVYGDCNFHGAFGHYLPLWSRPTNIRQPKTPTKFLCVRAMMFHATLGFCIEQYIMSM